MTEKRPTLDELLEQLDELTADVYSCGASVPTAEYPSRLADAGLCRYLPALC